MKEIRTTVRKYNLHTLKGEEVRHGRKESVAENVRVGTTVDDVFMPFLG